MKKIKRLFLGILTFAAAVSILTVPAAAADLNFPLSPTVVTEITTSAEPITVQTPAAQTHAEQQVVIENVNGSGVFYNSPVPTTVAEPEKTAPTELTEENLPAAPTEVPIKYDSVITGLVAAPIAAVAVAGIAGAIAFAARKRKKKK